MNQLQIKTDSLGKRFNREWIFRGLTFTFNQGKVYAITGPNGSGKSTLMQILWGQMPPSEGSLSYHTQSRQLEPDTIYQHVSVATPYMDLIDEFTLKEQVDFHFRMKPVMPGLTSAEVIETMGLAHARDKAIVNFSSGMKQRVKLGLTFYTDTPVIFLDEPGTNLDRQAFDWYHENLDKIRHGKLILIASNQPDEYPANTEKIDLLSFKPNANKVL